MHNHTILKLIVAVLFICTGCVQNKTTLQSKNNATDIIRPKITTEKILHDTDDPAIWINHQDLSKSLILGTDKDEDGAIYVYDLEGKIIQDKTIRNLKRPNNIDIEYGFLLNNKPTDIAIATERLTHKLRVYSLPDMKEIDGGGIPVFEGEKGDYADPMGISIYKNKEGNIYAIVGRKNGPMDGTYLWQYLLSDNGAGSITAKLVRKFGNYSGTKEIESIAVDDNLGYVYYSDEGSGVRKYHANPDSANKELALFADKGFSGDHEGISIYKLNDTTGYILVSDQQANSFQIYKREGEPGNPHMHNNIKTIRVLSRESDGSEVTSFPLNAKFPDGIFVVMSDNKTFMFYSWTDIAGKELKKYSDFSTKKEAVINE